MNIMGLILGSTAALTIAAGAQAGDAVVADPLQSLDMQPVNTCDAYGTGFVPVPGTGTCVKVSGQVRYEQGFSNTTRTTHGRTTMDFETRSN
ncbi:MAG: Porin subfamily [Rhizobium sp.]|nr:Porin subfamily [Rhizobium sp.]